MGVVRLVRIPEGRFLMGSTDGPVDERPSRVVDLRRPFLMGVTPVTQAEYERITGESPSWFRDRPDHPVERVSWFDAVRACNRLSESERVAPYYQIREEEHPSGFDPILHVSIPKRHGTGYRLPTEAEWEHAGRAGTATRFWFGDDPAALPDHAWFADNSGTARLDSTELFRLEFHLFGKRLRDNGCCTRPVGLSPANPFGLCDMLGDVAEWCWDWYDESGYPARGGVDPVGPAKGEARTLRGGGWSSLPSQLRSASRGWEAPDVRLEYNGFRVARFEA